MSTSLSRVPRLPFPVSILAVIGAFMVTLFIAGSAARAADWPMWRHDAARGGASPEELPETLHLQWILELPTPRPAWPSNQDKLQFDRLYEPVLAGKSLFVGSMISDSVTAHDTDTGERRWRFYTGGPIRFAPAVHAGKVYCTSDDGYLYCLDAASGQLIWRLRGGPSDRMVLGNDRLINAWPARGAPVIRDGTVYFGASIWPFMGTFLHAVDAESGEILWTNSGTGSSFTVQQHNSPAFAGIAPQGYIAATEDRLIVAGGRTLPAVFDRATGEFLHFNVASRKMGSKGGGGYEVSAGKDCYINRGKLYRLDNGHFVANADALVITDHAIIGKDKDVVRGYRPRLVDETTKDRKGNETKTAVFKTTWSAPIEQKIDTIYIMSGSRIYATGERGEVLAIDLPRFDRGVSVSWSVKLPDQPLNMISGDGKLFISTDAGRIYCFGGGERGVKFPEAVDITLVPRGASWRYLDDGSDQGTGWPAPDFDDAAWASGEAPIGYGGEEATTVRFGDNKDRKHVTTYFRHEFQVDRSASISEVKLAALVDDGAVFHVNGKEVGRLFMPDGEVKHDTLAKSGTDEKTYKKIDVPADALRPGRNVLAVEVHQAARTSSDIVLDVELTAREASTAGGAVRLPETPSTLASAILAHVGNDEGYCVALGLGTGRLVESIASQTDFHVVVVEPDAGKVDAFRRRLDELGAYGTRVAAVVGDPIDVELPLYMADLVIAEDPVSAGIDRTAFVERVYRTLRPYSGAACFELDRSRLAAFESAVAASRLDGGAFERRGDLAILRRVRPPAGSGDWTHQYGDASNSVVTDERLVKAPLGLLWFGGPSNEEVLPRHGHGPTPHVAGGRLVIEGRHMLRAVDIYTGRLIWQRDLKDLGKFYDYTSHEPGANAIGGNYVTLEDAIYVIYENRCLRLDPATGETVATLDLPAAAGSGDKPEWGYLAVEGDILVAGARPTDAGTPEYTRHHFKSLADPKKKNELDDAFRKIEVLLDFEQPERVKDQTDVDYFVENVNKLLFSEDMVAHIPPDVRKRAKAEDLEKELADYLGEVPGRRATDMDALALKRHLLHKYYGMPKYERNPPGKFGSGQRMGSKKLVAMNRHTGEALWEHEARYQMRHNAIALGGGKCFFIDRIPESRRGYYRRRGLEVDEDAVVAARDLRTGAPLWTNSERVFGTWLGYSVEHDVLLQAGSKGRDRARDEIDKGMVAHRGSTGTLLWQNDLTYHGPCILLGDRVITQVSSAPGFALDIETGKVVEVPHPVTGEPVKWEYSRTYGCNSAIACPNMLTFRSAAAGYFDLAGDSGTGNFGGFRSGCTSNLIPAGGVLNAPDYTRTCTCSYQNQASLGLVHMPEIEMWTFSALKSGSAPVDRVGLNFGAPGDRRDPEGTMWLDYPSNGGSSPDVSVEVFSEDARYPRSHHSTLASAEGPAWVAASGFEGSGEIAVRLRSPKSLRVPNEVAGGSVLEAKNGVVDAAVPARVLRGRDNSTSLARGAEKLEAKILGSPSLASESVTVELWARADNDFDFVDARVSGEKHRHGLVIDNRDLRARYFVTNEKGDGPDGEAELKSKKRIPDNTWVHIAFTYDAASGLARLFLDGEEVARRDGPDGRPLWWDTREPDWAVAKDIGEKGRVDELRVASVALEPEAFLPAGEAGASSQPAPANDIGDHLIGYWRMEPTIGHGAGTYTVRLHFAEVDPIGPGERVFDVAVQGRPALTGFDIAREAGGARRAIVREIRNVPVSDHLRIKLTPVRGKKPLLGGVEVISTSRSF